MKQLLILALMFVSSWTLQAQESPRAVAVLTAQFSGVSSSTKHVFMIKNDVQGKWVIEEFLGCLEYPCDPESRTLKTVVLPVMTSSSWADGNTEILLGGKMTLTYFNHGFQPPAADGSRKPSYWQLDVVGQNGKLESVKMDLVPMITHR